MKGGGVWDRDFLVWLGFNYVCVGEKGVVEDTTLSVKAREESQFAVVGPGVRWVKAPRLLRFKVGAGC